MGIVKLVGQKWKGTMEFKRVHGWKKTIIVIKRTIFRQPVNDLFLVGPAPVTAPDKEATAQDLLNMHFRSLQAIPYIRNKDKVNRLNLVLDSIETIDMLDNKLDAIVIATEYARKHDMLLRIITRNASANPNYYKNVLEWCGLEPYTNVEFYSDYNRDYNGDIQYKIDLSETDLFMATSWQSAMAVRKISIRSRFFYVMTDLEDLQYAHAEARYLSKQILSDSDIDFIVPSYCLNDCYEELRIMIPHNSIYYETVFSKATGKLKGNSEKDKYHLLYTANPARDEDMFYYGLELLDYAVKTGVIDSEKWKIYYIAQDIPHIAFGESYDAIKYELNDVEHHKEFLCSIDLGISLKSAPYIGRTAYELILSGAVVLTNHCEGKVVALECDNMIHSELDKECFVKKMEEAIVLVENNTKREDNHSKAVFVTDWQTNVEKVIELMQEKL